jgi:hypothetical protein
MGKRTKITKYANGTVAKMHNRRLIVKVNDNDQIEVGMRILDGCLEPRSSHDIIGGKIVNTTIKLSREVAESLVVCLVQELNRNVKNEDLLLLRTPNR